MSLLQKLASRTGGVGLRSVIRLIRDILVDNHLADANIGQMAGPEYFYDVLHADMERNAAKEIVIAADKAVQVFNGNQLAVRICKTIAVMQLLDDFNLSFDNLCALLYNIVGVNIDKVKVRQTLEDIMQTDGLTLQEIDGKYQFMTNAILGIREERNKIIPRDSEKAEVLQKQLIDIFTPAPSVNVYQSKTITAGVELTERNRPYIIHAATSLKINVRFVEGSNFDETHQYLLTESTRNENSRTLFWLCTLGKDKDKESILQDIVRSQNIKNRHQNETNKEIQAYLRAQSENADEKKRQLGLILREAMANSEIIFRGNPQQVNAETYKTVALKSIAEKVFEKYPLASTNMKADCVSKLASYSDITTIPDALNPFKIINKSKGTIDTSNLAISAIKDFIASRNEVTGQELMNYFERDPYGWAKDTIRYIVALTLKASVIQLRVAGKNITVFGNSAVDAMANNNSFNKISITLNTEGALSIPELLNAAQNLVSLFNCGRVAPVKDHIAKEAYGKIKYYLPRFNNLLPTFETYGLAGLSQMRSAINYAQRIIDSEGGEAAYLLGKDNDCVNAFKYAMDIMKCNQTASLFDHIKHINHIMQESKNLPELIQLADFRKHMNDVAQLYNDYIKTPDLHHIVSEITDLKNQVDSYLQQGRIEFQTQSNAQLNDSRDEIKAMPEFEQLTDVQKIEIETLLNRLNVDCRSNSIESLREMVNTYVSYNMNNVAAIKCKVKNYAKTNAPAVTVTSPPDSKEDKQKTDSTVDTQPDNTKPNNDNAHEPEYKPLRLSLKRKITTRQELQDVINALSKLLNTVGDNSPVELNINE